MIRLGAGYLASWGNLSEEQRADALDLARRMWGNDAEWAALSEAARIFAVLRLPMVARELDPIADTVRCVNCRDTGFQPGREYGLWFCAACDKGLAMEAGYWRRLRFPEVRGRRVASTEGKRRFAAYAALKPQRAERIRVEITRLVLQEQERPDQSEGA